MIFLAGSSVRIAPVLRRGSAGCPTGVLGLHAEVWSGRLFGTTPSGAANMLSLLI